MEAKFESQNGFLIIIPNKYVVLVEGFVVGPFTSPNQALTWAYDNAKDGIFTLKEMMDPRVEI